MPRMLRDVNTGELYSYNAEMAKLDYMEEVDGKGKGKEGETEQETDADSVDEVVEEEVVEEENGDVTTTTTAARSPRPRRR